MNAIETLYSHFLQSTGVSTDTRQLKSGNIFFALKGPYFDANSLISDALKAGALLAVSDHLQYQNHEQVMVVDDVLLTLQQLAAFHRRQMKANVIAITGTNGKTTTKELTARVLATTFKTIATHGNLNNHIGVPLSLLEITPDTEMAVIEMGANHMGEIMLLCRLARPDYGLITNIGKAHLEGFGSITGVINAKSELYNWIDDHGKMLFVYADNELLNELSARIRRFTYGANLTNDLYGELVANDPWLHLAWEYRSSQSVVNTQIIGSYNAENILAAIAIGAYFGVETDRINQAVSSYVPSNNRSQLIQTAKNRVIMDAYNANPVSMAASIRNFDAISNERPVLILGDMLELGQSSDAEHAEILKLVTDLGFKRVYLVGPCFGKVYAGDDWLHFDNANHLADYLKKNPIRQADILLKASRGIHLETVLGLL
ncbi:MAG: UDP-N-acetylmuramoyl-tripeptide--D-alanyl-D-alanine ligase [Bacteroidales bacterium]|nr:UDP-N-acetylmuramoyl-tripeptide--D-alanyl-D-alanine ligase [Bacteroidales bacterium]